MASKMEMTPPATTPSSPGGSRSDGNLGSKIASLRVRLREEHVARLKEAMAGSIYEECQKQEDAIKSAWEAIEKAMEAFNAHKRALFEAMREDEGQDRTQQAIDAGGLDRIMPSSFQMIVDRLALPDLSNPKDASLLQLLSSRRQPSPVNLLGDSSRQPSPAHSSSGGPKDALPSPAVTPTSATAPPIKQYTAKRSRPQITLPQDPEPPSAKRARASEDRDSNKSPTTKNRDLPSWEVDGKEYIFPFPHKSDTYYVLRCESSAQHPHLTFKTNPFGHNSPAMDHYNNAKRCKGGHGTGDKDLMPHDIVKRWGYRVSGVDVTKGWVDAANGRLAELERLEDGRSLDSPAKRTVGFHVKGSAGRY